MLFSGFLRLWLSPKVGHPFINVLSELKWLILVSNPFFDFLILKGLY
jgi:hypothetical protein